MFCQRSAVPFTWTVPLMNRATPAIFWAWIDLSQSRQTWTRTILSYWTCALPLLLADPRQLPPPQQIKMATQRTLVQSTRQTGPPHPQELQMGSQAQWRRWPWRKSHIATDHIPDHQYLDCFTRLEEGSNVKGGSTCCRPVRSHQMC